MRRFRVLLDANVLVDAHVRDLFFRMAEAELIDVRWSAALLAETRRALVENLHLDPTRVDRLLGAMNRAFPAAVIDGFEHLIDQIELPDVDDRHVLAAAVHGECDFLVTYNDKDFPDDCGARGDVEMLTVDEAICLLAGVFADRIAPVVLTQIASLRRPSLTTEEFLDRLATRAPIGAAALGVALGVESYARIFSEMIDSESDAGPQGAVRRLLAAVEGADAKLTASLVTADFAAQLTGIPAPAPTRVLDALGRALDDIFTTEGWGMATARRLHAPDVELVKLIRAGPTARIAFEPEAVHGHLFYMQSTLAGWILAALDGPDPAITGDRSTGDR